MQFRLLGSLEVSVAGHPVDLEAARLQVIVAVLLLEANNVVSVSRLIDAIWDDDPPATARSQVQICISTLRRLLEERSPTYALADITVESRDGPHDYVVDMILEALRRRAGPATRVAAEPEGLREVSVALGDRAYKIRIGEGLLASAGAHIAALAPGGS